MAVKTTKKVIVDTKVLKEWLKNHKMTYRDLAKKTGMSLTQAYYVTQKPIGGATTLGFLIDLNIPGLLYLVTYEVTGKKKRVIDVQNLQFQVK